MKYDFQKAHGAKLVNLVVTFLKNKHIVPMVPKLDNYQKRVMYTSEDSLLVITFYSTTNKHGYFEIRQVTKDGIPHFFKTPVFLYI